MRCETCEYENPREATVCVECGAGLGRRARKRAQRRFRSQLEEIRDRAEERMERELRRRETPKRPGGRGP